MTCPPSRSYQRNASSRASANSCSLRLRPQNMRSTVPARRIFARSVIPLGHHVTMTVALMIIGLVIGVALGWLAARARSAGDIARLDATLQATRAGEERLAQSLRALSHEA